MKMCKLDLPTKAAWVKPALGLGLGAVVPRIGLMSQARYGGYEKSCMTLSP